VKHSDNVEVLARKEWDRLRAALEMKCKDFMVKKDSNQVAFIAPGKKLTFTFDPDSLLFGGENRQRCNPILFRLSEDKATGHFFESQRLMNLPNHLVHGLPKTTIDKIAADAFRYLSH